MVRLVAGAAMISFAPVFVKVTSVPPTASAFYRVLFGGILLLPFLWRRRERVFRGRVALVAMVVAGLFFALDLGFWHASIVYVGPGLATLLANFQVFILAVLGIVVFHERWRWEVLVSIPLALIGLGLIIGLDWRELGSGYRLGIVFGLLTAVCYAAYILSLRRVRIGARSSTAGDLAVVSLVSAAFLALGALVGNASLTIPSWQDAGILVAYAAVAQVLGWILISGSLSQIPPSRVGLILLLQPLLAFVWDVLFFARAFTPIEGIGALLALLAIYLGSRRPG